MLFSKQRKIDKPIPDNDLNGLLDRITVDKDLIVKDVEVEVHVQHPYNGDLSIELIGPNGKSVNLHSPSRSPGTNLHETFGDSKMEIFHGIKAKGDWTIKVIDSGKDDEGYLKDWTLRLNLEVPKWSEIFIPDEETLTSTQHCQQGGNISSIKAHVKVKHDYIGDLILDLVSPSGTKVTLHNKEEGDKKMLDKNYAKELDKFLGEPAKGIWKLEVSDTMPRDTGSLISWKLNVKTITKNSTQQTDDLTKIEGIGPKIAGLIKAEGIMSFGQLAKTSADKIKAILEKAGSRFQMHDPTSWPTQAQLAADGEWKKLEKLQDELNGGR